MSLSSESCSNNLIKPEMGIMANFDSYSFGQKYRGELGLSTDGVWNLSTKKKERKKKYKLAQHESGEPTFIWGKMRTVAQKTESQIALRKVEGKVNIFDFAEGQFHAIKHVFIGFLLIMMSWCHREGIHCFSTYEERQGLSSQNQFLKISNYLKTHPSSFPGLQSSSLSTPNSPPRVMKVEICGSTGFNHHWGRWQMPLLSFSRWQMFLASARL